MKNFTVEFGENCIVQEFAIVGFKYKADCKRTRIGHNALIRAFTIIYADVEIGSDFKTGHGVVIRENTQRLLFLLERNPKWNRLLDIRTAFSIFRRPFSAT